MPPELRALIDGSRDAVMRVVVDLRQKAEAAESLRSAEHRAFMAEQREALATLTRAAEERIAAVRDGVDGRNGADGRDGEPGDAGPQGERGHDGENGQPGRDGADGRDGIDGVSGKDGESGASGADGLSGSDGADGSPGRDGENGARGEPGQDGRDGVDGKGGADAYPGEACGLHDPDATYRALDVVSFNGCEWRAKRDDPGALPGDGWMLSASRGKRGDRGERGSEGAKGKDGAAIVAAYVDAKALQLVLTRDDGGETKADLYEFADVIRAASALEGARG